MCWISVAHILIHDFKRIVSQAWVKRCWHFFGVRVHRNVECPIQVLPNLFLAWLSFWASASIFCQRFSMAFMSGLSAKSIANLSTTCESAVRLKTIQISAKTPDSTVWIISDMIVRLHSLTQFVNCQTAYSLECFSIICGHARCAIIPVIDLSRFFFKLLQMLQVQYPDQAIHLAFGRGILFPHEHKHTGRWLGCQIMRKPS